MRKQWLVILALMLITSAFAYEVIAYQEDFESGADGWTHYDAAESPNMWAIYNYGNTQGEVWWMGDTDLAVGDNIGGYYNSQYLVLDTPARTLTAANATLTFKMRIGLEDPAVHEGYDGWDSCNIRLSTDGGNTWNVINGSPAYDFSNSYAFGFEHGEGMGVPGWGGIVTNWTPATFDLSAYIGQSVMIRFAFASDPAYSTADQPNMFGFMVDDISFGGYTNNGTDDGQMTSSSMVPLGGDLWHLATEATAPSPTHVMKCQNDQGTYNDNMLNYLVSPSITLPSSTPIWCDFMIMGEFNDPGTFPDVDYFGWEISPDDGFTWHYMSNPYGNPDGTNYVYSDAPAAWASMIQSYSLDGVISDYAGETVKFRWLFRSNATPAQGPGIMIDDFTIYTDVFVAPPEDLVAEVEGSNVQLYWDAPGSGGGDGEEGWLSYCVADNLTNSIGTNGVADFDVAAKWDALGDENSIYPYVGMNITKISFHPSEALCEYSVRVWTGASNTLVVDQPVPNPVIGTWNEVILDTPYTIPPGTEIKIGFRNNAQAGYPAGVDDGPTVDGYGNWINLGGWSTLIAAADLEGNWGLKAYVADADGREYALSPIPQNETFAMGELKSMHNHRGNRNVSMYRIYRDSILIDQVDGDLTEYLDMNVEGGTHTYYVTAMYDAIESSASNSQTVFVIPAQHSETYFDDGEANEGYNVGSTNQMAVLHNWHNFPVTLKYAKIYIMEPTGASLIVRAYNVDPATGLPAQSPTSQVQYAATNVTQGWNYVPFASEVVFPEGKFYLALMETPNAPQIGLDTDNSGHSFTGTNVGEWQAFDDGEIMIRAIVYTGTSTEDGLAPALKLSASNYPNPFNPTTTISYTVPESGPTTLKVYNLKGQLVDTLVDREMAAGTQTVTWNGTDAFGKAVSSGLYLLRIENSGKAITRKMLLAK